MIEGVLGKKIGMSRIFTEEGDSVGVTLISCGPCWVVDSKDDRVQLGYLEAKEKSLGKPRIGYLKKRGIPPVRHLQEVKLISEKAEAPKIGDSIGIDIFEVGDRVDVSGTSKGKGFAGVMKRWNFKGGPAGHGSRFHRAPGAIGNASDPSRVFPGLKMAGRLGGVKITQMNLEVIAVDRDENILAVKGSIPGPKNRVVFVRKTTRGKNGS